MNASWTVFTITMIVLTGALVLAVYWPWPDVMQPERRLHLWAVPGCTECAETDPPPCNEHGARELGGIPPYHPERVVMRAGWPPELADIEKRLASEDSLARGCAAEQDAHRTADEGTI
jgi:hypothetical protein